MPKRKSKLIGFLLAIFAGPVSFLYVGKWKKTLLLFPLLLVPYLNAIIYLFTLFAIVSDVKTYNLDAFDDLRYGIVGCRCGSRSKSGSKFCSNCGTKLVKTCKACKHDAGKNERYCHNCGNVFEDMVKGKFLSKKPAVIASIAIISVLILSLTFLLAVEQHNNSKYVNNARLTNFSYPSRISGENFTIHYELSEKKPSGIKGIKTYINGTNVFVKDEEAVFDGKSIDWIVRVKKKGTANFNVTLYYKNKLLDSKQLNITRTG